MSGTVSGAKTGWDGTEQCCPQPSPQGPPILPKRNPLKVSCVSHCLLVNLSSTKAAENTARHASVGKLPQCFKEHHNPYPLQYTSKNASH